MTSLEFAHIPATWVDGAPVLPVFVDQSDLRVAMMSSYTARTSARHLILDRGPRRSRESRRRPRSRTTAITRAGKPEPFLDLGKRDPDQSSRLGYLVEIRQQLDLVVIGSRM